MSWGLLRDQWRGWDHLGVLLSLAYRLLRCLFGLLAVLVRSDLSKDAELLVLRHENQVLRRQLTVWEILHAAGIDPAPRRAGPTWRQFLTARRTPSSPVTSWL